MRKVGLFWILLFIVFSITILVLVVELYNRADNRYTFYRIFHSIPFVGSQKKQSELPDIEVISMLPGISVPRDGIDLDLFTRILMDLDLYPLKNRPFITASDDNNQPIMPNAVSPEYIRVTLLPWNQYNVDVIRSPELKEKNFLTEGKRYRFMAGIAREKRTVFEISVYINLDEINKNRFVNEQRLINEGFMKAIYFNFQQPPITNLGDPVNVFSDKVGRLNSNLLKINHTSTLDTIIDSIRNFSLIPKVHACCYISTACQPSGSVSCGTSEYSDGTCSSGSVYPGDPCSNNADCPGGFCMRTMTCNVTSSGTCFNSGGSGGLCLYTCSGCITGNEQCSGTSCSCTSWVNGACGAGGCTAGQRYQSRTCTPSGCSSTTRCITDATCTSPTTTSTPGSVCTPGQWGSCGGAGCGSCDSAQCNSTGTGWQCVWNPGTCCTSTSTPTPTRAIGATASPTPTLTPSPTPAPGQCALPGVQDPQIDSCVQPASRGSIVWQWLPVPGATEYQVDIYDVGNGGLEIDNDFIPDTTFNCNTGICSYPTDLFPGTYQLGVQARGTCAASATGTSEQVTLLNCAIYEARTKEITPGDISCPIIQASGSYVIPTTFGLTSGTINMGQKTQTDGNYVRWDTAEPGTYTLTVNAPAGYVIQNACWTRTSTIPTSGSGLSVEAASGETVTWYGIGLTLGAPWVQTEGGDVLAATIVKALMADTVIPREFNIAGTGGYSGVVSYGSSYDFDPDVTTTGGSFVSANGWLVNENGLPLYTKDWYSAFAQKYDLTGNSQPYTGPAEPASSTTPYYYNGNTSIGNWAVANGENIVLFVNGDVSITGPITTTGTGFVAIIASGDMSVNSSVGVAYTSSTPSLEGLYVTNGTFSTGTSQAGVQRFVARGTFVANAFLLQRDLTTVDQNHTTSAELFIYDPQLMFAMPDEFRDIRLKWEETAP